MSDSSQILVFDRALRRARGGVRGVLAEEGAALLRERVGDVRRAFARRFDFGDQDADEEAFPFAPESFDLIVSNMRLHWVNDLPRVLAHLREALRPEGLFLAALLGGATLQELRTCLMDAELAVTGGVSPRVSPTLDLGTASALLQQAGFQLPVADQETITLVYPDMFALMRDVRSMGEANAHTQRLKHFTRRAVFTEAARLYQDRFPAEGGGIRARFDLVFLHGWRD